MAVSRTGKLKHRVAFMKRDGFTVGTNGTKIPAYKEANRVWFGYKQKFLSEIKSEDMAYKNTVNIVIRQKQKEEVQPDWIAVIKGTEYEITEINPDVENEEFMLLILKAVE